MGNVVSKNGIMEDLAKIEAIRYYIWFVEGFSTIGAPLTRLTRLDVPFELSEKCYYIWFVEGFSTIGAPLTRLTRLDVPFELSEECELSFRKLKEFLSIALILDLLIEVEGFTVY
ncbi:hypothetical protein MTR67_034674 [Solanum verrucosum]|uniref:Uncharacterized protein n=1 Tax=Solanum verrucosum TaxID=315347 RepID=A0AAF0U8S8_SOLVR|nr:hypothetical protein MTR67_034674 [Solanum verrucosum]